MTNNEKTITTWFGENLAKILATKIQASYAEFDSKSYIKIIKRECEGLSYTKRVELHADVLKEHLPDSYPRAIEILNNILGDENPNETGMFKVYYWVLPIGKFVEKYGLENFDLSMRAIEEITKRNTGEYAIRPYIRKYPQRTIQVMQKWAGSSSFHLRRLASEGCRPKLPWATKLDVFIEKPEPVFKILECLIADRVKFVQKSVANNLTDYLKVNKPAAVLLIRKYLKSENCNTQWIIKHATRKFLI